MKSYNLRLDLQRILAIADMSAAEFSRAVGVSRVTLDAILDGKNGVSKETYEKIYSFAYRRDGGLNLNRGKELLFIDDAKGAKLLFHGAKGNIDGDIDTKHSMPPNDLGDGFYTGETFLQAATWIAKSPLGSVYAFYLKDDSDLEVTRIEVGREWLYAILHYRNAFKGFAATEDIASCVARIERSDIVIAPIADHEMFKIIDAFGRSEITDEACLHALIATNLGYQYVFKSEKACKRLAFIDRLYLCEKEKADCLLTKDENATMGIQKARLALIEYRREGKYFDELFTRQG